MNRSKPSIVVGGGEMKRATSSVESIASSDVASEIRSSRSVTMDPVRTGSDCFQSDVTVAEVRLTATEAWTFDTGCTPRRLSFSIRAPLREEWYRCQNRG